MAILERETSAIWGGANMHVVRAVISEQLGLIASLATESTGGEILVVFLDQKWPQKRSQSAQFKKFSWGSMPKHLLMYNVHTDIITATIYSHLLQEFSPPLYQSLQIKLLHLRLDVISIH